MGTVRSFALYLVAGLAVTAGLLSVIAFTTHAWSSFIFFSTLLAVALAKMYWSVRRVVRVWLLLVLFMTMHTGAYLVLLRHFHDWPALWYVLTMPFEIMLFAAIAWRWLKVNPPLKGRF